MLFQSVSFMLKFDFIVAKLEIISEIMYFTKTLKY